VTQLQRDRGRSNFSREVMRASMSAMEVVTKCRQQWEKIYSASSGTWVHQLYLQSPERNMRCHLVMGRLRVNVRGKKTETWAKNRFRAGYTGTDRDNRDDAHHCRFGNSSLHRSRKKKMGDSHQNSETACLDYLPAPPETPVGRYQYHWLSSQGVYHLYQ